MSEYSITVEGGTSKRLLTAGKYCDRDIVVTATGGGGSGDIAGIVDGTITDLTIPEGASAVKAYALYNRTALKTVRMPSTMTAIGDYAFSGATALEEINIPDSVTTIGKYAFEKAAKAKIESLPPVVTSIGDNAFYNCSEATFDKIPSGLTTLSRYVFYGCKKATFGKIPEGVKSIQTQAFYNCQSLPMMDCPASLTSISSMCFQGLGKVKAYAFRNTTAVVTMSNSNAFSSSFVANILVPSALVDEYKAATNWSSRAGKIKALEDYTVDGTVTGELDVSKL